VGLGEHMNGQDLQLLEVLDFDPHQGFIMFHDQRMLIQGAGAMGLLRKEMIETLGAATTRRLLLRFGYADGYHDAVSFRAHFQWRDPVEGMLAGITLHRLEGIVHAEPVKLEYDPTHGLFDAEISWQHSYEAEQHLHHHGRDTQPVCWTLVGYMSGFASACLGNVVYFRETACAGQGAARCSLIGRNAEAWDSDLTALRLDFEGADLKAQVDGLRASVKRQQQERERRRRELDRQEREIEQLGDRAVRHALAKHFVARSTGMRDVLELAARVAPLDTTILITGESGTGKEFIAQMIHEQSPRVRAPLVSVNCAALTETLLESELFGHVRGAFTGAARDKAGLFEQAARGTLFLDEIGDMTPALQGKLLRALQEREIRPVGGDRVVKVTARIVAATNRDLRVQKSAGTFREDLYFRLAGFVIALPPLRDRHEDIPFMAHTFLRRSAEHCQKDVRGISADCMTRLIQYPWPGNVRELEHAIERAVILARSPVVSVRDLAPEIRDVTAAAEPHHDPKTYESRLINDALNRYHGHRRRVAEALGISTVSLWRKMKRYGIAG
jgi:DNA-binding NtrC family response regulator